jgi:site-specific recombinase XerD
MNSLTQTPISPESLIIRPSEYRNGISTAGSLIGDDDEDAVRSWLVEFSGVATTQRAYRKEAGRFLRWAKEIAGKSLRELDRSDIEAYRGFMAAPPASWLGTRRGERGTVDWRPFERAVTPAGERYTLIVLGSLFAYLVNGRYLNANPIALVRKKGSPRAPLAEKTISKDQVKALLTFLRERAEVPTLTGIEKRKAWREWFVCFWLYHTGARREELAGAMLNDVRIGNGDARWTVRGKGGKTSWIPLSANVIKGLSDYIAAINIDVHDLQQPLLQRLRNNGSLATCDDQVRDVVKFACTSFAQALKGRDQKTMLAVTPHWFRHAITAHMLDAGVDPRYVQRFLRHSSLATTMLYDSTNDNSFANAVTQTL